MKSKIIFYQFGKGEQLWLIEGENKKGTHYIVRAYLATRRAWYCNTKTIKKDSHKILRVEETQVLPDADLLAIARRLVKQKGEYGSTFTDETTGARFSSYVGREGF